MRRIDYLIVHTADTQGDVSADTIRRWHIEERGWSDIGYHQVVRRNGDIEMGRPLERIGAHVIGKNRHSIGICLAGGYRGAFDYTDQQLDSLELLLRGLLGLFPDAEIRGHNDFTDSKTCPNFDALAWARERGICV